MFEVYKDSQPIAYKIVQNTLNKQHYVHAYLIETKGFQFGLDFAITFAKLLLCPNFKDGQTVCNNCSQCKMIDSNNFTELKIINPDSNSIKKEELIDLQEEFSKKPLFGKNKVYIINNAYKLNNNSSNAILKFLEEPQPGIIAILITDNIYQLLDTIVSRCQIISLNKSTIKYDSTIKKIGSLLTNNKDDFDHFIENESNTKNVDAVLDFVDYYEKFGKKILLYMNEYWFNYFNDKEKVSDALTLMIYFYKDVLNYKIQTPLDFFDDYVDIVEKISNKNSIENLTYKITKLNENKILIENNANLQLLMDRIVIELEVNRN